MVATSGGGNNFAFILNCAFKDNAVYNVGNVDRSVLDLLEELLEDSTSEIGGGAIFSNGPIGVEGCTFGFFKAELLVIAPIWM